MLVPAMGCAEFQRIQYAIAAHLRDPQRNPPPAQLEDRRVAIYRDLFYNNIESLLASNFPVIRRITTNQRWHQLVRGFYANYACHTPLFTEIGREFHCYLGTLAENDALQPAFLAELAHYEWVELALSLDECNIDHIAHDPGGDLLAGVPLVSPLAWALAYRFPVHRIREEFQPDSAADDPTFLIVVRNRGDDVGFMEVNALTMKLIESLKENSTGSGMQCLQALAAGIDPGTHTGDPELVGPRLRRALRAVVPRDRAGSARPRSERQAAHSRRLSDGRLRTRCARGARRGRRA